MFSQICKMTTSEGVLNLQQKNVGEDISLDEIFKSNVEFLSKHILNKNNIGLSKIKYLNLSQNKLKVINDLFVGNL